MISQLTVFLENKEGRLASAVRSIARADINMQAMFLADTKDFGILRIFCDTPEKACRILQEEGYQARLIDVVAVKVPNVPGRSRSSSIISMIRISTSNTHTALWWAIMRSIS